MWILAYGATWSYFREGHKWQAVLPTGLAMLVNLYYGPPSLNGYFVIYLLTAILLLVRATLAEREAGWYCARVQFPFDISFDFMRDGILFAIFVIFASWVLPSAADNGQLNPVLEPLQGPWEEFKQEWDRLFSTVNYNTGNNTRAFGTALALGGPREVTDAIVMDIDTPVDRYYRAVFMDTYLQGGWFLGQSEGVRLGDDNDFDINDLVQPPDHHPNGHRLPARQCAGGSAATDRSNTGSRCGDRGNGHRRTRSRKAKSAAKRNWRWWSPANHRARETAM